MFGRGRQRFKRRKFTRYFIDSWPRQRLHLRLDVYREGQDKHHRRREHLLVIVTARHGALHEPRRASMMAFHRRFTLSLTGRHHGLVLVRLVPMDWTLRAVATFHPVGLPCSSPHRRPEKQSRNQAHPCALDFSWSDRRLERSPHCRTMSIPHRFCHRKQEREWARSRQIGIFHSGPFLT